MLEALLDDLATDTRYDTVRSGASKTSAAPPSAKAAVMPRDTFAVRGDERFSERDAETSREAKAAAKKKVVAAGAKPAMGGDAGWEALQMQMKKQAAAKQQQQQGGVIKQAPASQAQASAPKTTAKAMPRETFAVPGDERFSERKAEPPKKATTTVAPPAAAPAAARNTRAIQAAVAAAPAAAPASKQADLPRGTFAVPGNERFSGRESNPNPKRSSMSERPKRTSLRYQGEPVEVEAVREKAIISADADELDAELAALEMDLGDNLGKPPRGGGRETTAEGRTISMDVSLGEAFGTAKPLAQVQTKKKPVPVEPAKGGPDLPAGMKWVQTPVKTATSSRQTFAHAGDERFSERADPTLPKGTLTQSPDRLCAYCHKEIVAGQKFKTALNQLWHQECFKCGICMKPLAKGMKFFRGDLDSAVCEDCKGKRKNTCPLCQKPLAKQEAVNVMGQKIHTKCFRCNICDCSLLGGYLQKKGHYLCIAHKDADPVERDYTNPLDRGPGEAPAKHPVKTGPTDEEKRRIAEKKKQDAELARQEEARRAAAEQKRAAAERAAAEEEHRARSLSYYRNSTSRKTVTDSDIQQSSAVIRDENAFDAQLLQDLLDNEEAEGHPQPPPHPDDDDDDDEDEDAPRSGEDAFAHMDKADWQKEREAQERGSFRTNARKAQEDLNRKQGQPQTYYEIDEDEDDGMDYKTTVQVQYTQQQSQQKPQQRRK